MLPTDRTDRPLFLRIKLKSHKKMSDHFTHQDHHETEQTETTDIATRIKNSFGDNIQTSMHAADVLLPILCDAANAVLDCLLNGNKLLSCGNGGSACDALRFTSEMINRFREERPGLPAIALASDIATLTAIANDHHYQDIFSRQVRALGQRGDILITLCTHGHSTNILHAIRAAHDRGLHVIALTGHDGGKVASLLAPDDLEIRVPAHDPARIQEMHLLILHSLCDVIDFRLFGQGDSV